MPQEVCHRQPRRHALHRHALSSPLGLSGPSCDPDAPLASVPESDTPPLLPVHYPLSGLEKGKSPVDTRGFLTAFGTWTCSAMAGMCWNVPGVFPHNAKCSRWRPRYTPPGRFHLDPGISRLCNFCHPRLCRRRKRHCAITAGIPQGSDLPDSRLSHVLFHTRGHITPCFLPDRQE